MTSSALFIMVAGIDRTRKSCLMTVRMRADLLESHRIVSGAVRCNQSAKRGQMISTRRGQLARGHRTTGKWPECSVNRQQLAPQLAACMNTSPPTTSASLLASNRAFQPDRSRDGKQRSTIAAITASTWSCDLWYRVNGIAIRRFFKRAAEAMPLQPPANIFHAPATSAESRPGNGISTSPRARSGPGTFTPQHYVSSTRWARG
jgi:hypothetical protein